MHLVLIILRLVNGSGKFQYAPIEILMMLDCDNRTRSFVKVVKIFNELNPGHKNFHEPIVLKIFWCFDKIGHVKGLLNIARSRTDK